MLSIHPCIEQTNCDNVNIAADFIISKALVWSSAMMQQYLKKIVKWMDKKEYAWMIIENSICDDVSFLLCNTYSSTCDMLATACGR